MAPTIGTTPYQANLSFTANSSGNASASGQLFSMISFSNIGDASAPVGVVGSASPRISWRVDATAFVGYTYCEAGEQQVEPGGH